jgi:hypothetical protein
MTHYNQLLVSSYMMHPISQLQCTPNLALPSQQSANEAFLQNVAFNKLVFDLYARLFANSCSSTSTSPTEIKQEHSLNWLTSEPVQNPTFNMNDHYKFLNVGPISNS